MKFIKILVVVFPCLLFGQKQLTGVILEAHDTQEIPLAGANVYWLDTSIGDVTDLDGKFSLPYEPNYKQLVVSYVGYQTDTIAIASASAIVHKLRPTSNLDEVTLSARKKSSATSYLESQNIVNISSDELLKAACCNLSESFETNPSIDVNFADAISGTRQIKMLGLTSPYILIATENIPSIRGASQAFGLSFIPGTWVESIQITKGAGSVTNGYESIAGQINAELQKPIKDDRLFVNVFAASSLRTELNTHINTKLSDTWSTGVYVHGNMHQERHDKNDDGFLDMPLYHQINVMNRWQYTDTEKGFVGFFNVKYLIDEKQTGQVDFDPDRDAFTSNAWGSEIDTKRFEASAKFGYVNPELPWQSLGVQAAFSNHEQRSYFGFNAYDIVHNSLYANLFYNSIISDSRHKIKTGLSATNDHYNERVNAMRYKRSETSVGAFFEYSFDNLEAINLTAGLRVDYHIVMGTFITPRFHIRYTPWEKSAFRASFGKGKRTASVFAENQRLFASSRVLNILDTDGDVYGLEPETAWNFGVSYLQGFQLFGRKADVTIDFYRTSFENQVIVDYETPGAVSIYNLRGDSYANSYQVELNHNTFERFDLRMAYKYYDIQTDYLNGKNERPLTPKHRVFFNASYSTATSEKGSRWKFDTTFNWLGKQRFANTNGSPEAFQRPEFSKTVSTLNAQVTRVFSPEFEIYFGGENITNTRQSDPIISAEDPFGAYFDTTQVYGPIFGSMYYAGLRFKMN